MENGVIECRWRHAPEARGGFWEILKKSVSRVETRHRTKRLTFACWRRLWAGGTRVGGGGQMKKKDCVSLFWCRKTFKLKGNKKFREVVSVFRVSRSYVLCYIYIYIYIYEHYMSISYTAVSGYVTYALTKKCCPNTYTYTQTHTYTHTHIHIYIYIYIYIYLYISGLAASTNFPDSSSLLVAIIHHIRQIF